MNTNTNNNSKCKVQFDEDYYSLISTIKFVSREMYNAEKKLAILYKIDENVWKNKFTMEKDLYMEMIFHEKIESNIDVMHQLMCEFQEEYNKTIELEINERGKLIINVVDLTEENINSYFLRVE